ncbi:MAG: ABC transporter ATP-binding protein [Proteobacteria bacterium]|nr:MAG: ABC transporter ATP-binding protein [Pseudomonadota bacterium]
MKRRSARSSLGLRQRRLINPISICRDKRPCQNGSMPIDFEVKDLIKSYGGHKALNRINLSLEKGSMTLLLGSNGSGKSTLMRCLAGHMYWDSGEIFRFGQDRRTDRTGYNAGLHFISEDITPPQVPLKDLRELYKSLYGKFDDEIFNRLISLSGISLDKNLTQVSRGQKIQGLLALSLAVHPETLLIDEATAVLDPHVRDQLMKELSRMNADFGMTILLATNIANEITSLKGRLIVMRAGSIHLDKADDQISMEEVLLAFEQRETA